MLLLLLVLSSFSEAQQQRRQLWNSPYYSTSDLSVLGAPDTSAALGNPLKGLYGGARWAKPPLPEAVPLSIEWYNVGVRTERNSGKNRFVCILTTCVF
jgi:hypothetical protein